MRPATDIKNNGSTETKFSSLRLLLNIVSTDLEKVFSFFLPTARFGFDKPVLAIANLAHLFLQKGRQKTNKLNSPPPIIGVLRTFFARVLNAPKRAPQAYGIFGYLYKTITLTIN